MYDPLTKQTQASSSAGIPWWVIFVVVVAVLLFTAVPLILIAIRYRRKYVSSSLMCN